MAATFVKTGSTLPAWASIRISLQKKLETLGSAQTVETPRPRLKTKSTVFAERLMILPGIIVFLMRVPFVNVLAYVYAFFLNVIAPPRSSVFTLRFVDK